MSTNVGTTSAVPPASPADELISDRIAEACKALWWAEIIRRTLFLAIVSMAALLVLAVIDQWILELGVMARVIIWIAAVTGLVWYVVKRIYPVLNSSIRPEYAARSLERDSPELRQDLTSYVTLRGDSRNKSLRGRVVRSIGSVAAGHLKRNDALPTEATGTLRWWIAAAAALAMLAGYAILSPKNTFATTGRLLAPLANIEPAKRVSIHDVQPGDTDAIAGRAVAVSARVDGLRADEPVYCRWESTSQEHEFELGFNEETQRFEGQIALDHSAAGTVRYRIEAGDDSAGPFGIAVENVPVVAIQSLYYEPPAYTGETPHTSSSASITAVDGTKITIRAKTNRPIAKASIEFNPRPMGDTVRATAGSKAMSIEADGTTLAVDFPLRSSRGRSSAVQLDSYRLRVWDDADQSNPDPIVYPIRVIADLPPEVSIVMPRKSPKSMGIDLQQIVEVHAMDPDFGLKQVDLEIRRGIDIVDRPILWSNPNGQKGNRVTEYRFRPSEHGLRVGDVVKIVAVATDNRIVPEDDSIEPNVSVTDPIEIRIVDEEPAPDPQGADDGLSEKDNRPPSDHKDDQNKQGGSNSKGEQGQKQGGGGGKGETGQQSDGDGSSGQGASGENQPDQKSSGEDSSSKGQGGKGQSQSSKDKSQNSEGSNDASQNGDANSDPNQEGSNGTSNGQPQNNSNQKQGQPKQNQGSENKGSENAKQPNQANQSDPNQSDPNQTGSNQADPNQEKPNQGDQNSQGHSGNQDPSKQNQSSPSNDNPNQNQNGSGQQSKGDSSQSPDPNNSNSDNPNSDNPNGQNQSSSDANDQSDQSGNGSPSKGQSGDGSDQQKGPPKHDGEAFERMRDYLDRKKQQEEHQEGGESRNESDQDQKSGKGSNSSKQEPQGSQGDEGEPNNDPSSGSQDEKSSKKNDKNSSSGNQNESGASGRSGSGNDDNPKENDQRQKSDGKNSAAENPSGQPQEDTSGGQDSKDNSGNNPSTDSQNDKKQGSGKSNEGNMDRENDDSQGSGSDSNNDDSDSGQTRQGNDDPSKQNQSEPSKDGKGDSRRGDSGKQDSGPDNSKSDNDTNRPKGRDSGDSDSAGNRDTDSSERDGEQSSTDGRQSDNSNETNGQRKGNPSQKSGNNTQSPSNTNPQGGDTSGASNTGSGDGGDAAPPPPAKPDLEYTKKATDMVLDYLEETRDAPDRELLEELDWTEQDLKQFADRWQKTRQKQPSDPNALNQNKEIQEALESLGLRPPGTGNANNIRQSADNLRSIRDSGNRKQAPAAYRDVFDAFRRSLGKQE